MFVLRSSRRRELHSYHCRLEPLESRQLLSAVSGPSSDSNSSQDEVPLGLGELSTAAALGSGSPYLADDPTAPKIILQQDAIPNFVLNPTNTSVQSGNWSDPQTWSGGQVPGEGSIVQVVSGTTVVYDAVSDANIKALGVNPGGKLEFATDRDTRLTLTTMIVFEGGTFQIGTQSNPLPAIYTAEIVIADVPLDLVNDPGQYSNGLLFFGKVDIFGNALDRTWQRLLNNPHAGDTQLVFFGQAPEGWKAGDTIILPDTRQVPGTFADDVANGVSSPFDPQWEEVVIASIDGGTVNLTAPLQYEHVGARDGDGVPEILPHAAVLDRNVVIRSENPDGTRGHVLSALRAEVDIRYARFKDLGRTDAFVPLDSTVFDEQGNAVHVGTNQIARYSLHAHRLIGPVDTPASGYQFQFIGNTIDGGRKWGVTIHGSSFGLIKDNVAYDIDGAAFATEDGSETGNDFIRNFAMRIIGTGIDGESGIEEGDFGRGGVGFWARRAGNNYRDNVATNALFSGFVIAGKLLESVVIPTGPGADLTQPGEGIEIANTTPGEFLRNNVYGRTKFGIWIAWPTAYRLADMNQVFEIKNSVLWNTTSSAISLDFTNNVLISGVRILGDINVLQQNNPNRSARGIMLSDHTNLNLVIQNSRIEGMKFGIFTPPLDNGGVPGGTMTVVRDTRLQNYVNVRVESAKNTIGKGLLLENVEWDSLAIAPLSDLAPTNVDMFYTPYSGRLLAPDFVRVLDANGDPEADYRLYYTAQRPDFIVPVSSPGVGGAPVPGLTNTELWDQFGQAIGGAVAPCFDGTCSNATTDFATTGDAFKITILAAASGPANIRRDQPFTLSLFAFDFSSYEQGDFTFRIDWDNDGQFDETIVGPSGTTVDRQFGKQGTATIRVVAENPFGDPSGEVTTNVNVIGYELLPNAEDPSLTDFIWYGTPGDDEVFFVPNDTSVWFYEAAINAQTTGDWFFVDGVTGSVIALGFDGDDTLTALGANREFSLFGGDGNDSLTGNGGGDFIDGGPGFDTIIGGGGDDFLIGGDGQDVIIGGDGDDVLIGNNGNDFLLGDKGRDLLIGGEGVDYLFGGEGEDLLVAGSTSFSDDPITLDLPALFAVHSEWISSRTYQQRIDNISGVGIGASENGANFLLPGLTVFGDNSPDTLLGGSETDWYFYAITAGTFAGSPLPLDSLLDSETGEQIVDANDPPPWW